jgi:demethylmenaquinone methyltransferase/2-methoxy-6-polyprenyl-1,4-benzoquinol methylase
VRDARSKARRGALNAPRDIREMFGRITKRYDLVNRLMTGGMDRRWRREVASLALESAPADGQPRILDVATGTGDLALTLADAGAPRNAAVVGLDFVGQMIAAAMAKRGDRSLSLLVGDAMRLPFPDRTFDAVTVAFGLRNMPDYAAALREMARVLRPGGRVVVLELTPMRRPILGRLFGLYFGRIVPFAGGLISGDRAAYSYLPRSVAAFPPAEDLAELMRSTGLTNVCYELRGAGTVAIHHATRPS